MPADNNEDKTPTQKESKGFAWQHILKGFRDFIYRLWALIRNLRIPVLIKLTGFKDYIYGLWARIQGLRIPIFIKLTALSTLLIFLVISTISFSMLSKQKKQFIGQLINLGESMVHIAASNAPDKLLGKEDMALFQLVKDISQNDQVIYALIIDEKNIIKAHSNIEEVNKAYSSPKKLIFIKETNNVRMSSFIHNGEEILFFEKPITYQKLKVGKVLLAISQKKILENIHDAKIFIFVLTIIIIIFGILLSIFQALS